MEEEFALEIAQWLLGWRKSEQDAEDILSPSLWRRGRGAKRPQQILRSTSRESEGDVSTTFFEIDEIEIGTRLKLRKLGCLRVQLFSDMGKGIKRSDSGPVYDITWSFYLHVSLVSDPNEDRYETDIFSCDWMIQ
jgi:hypothetical protein